MAPFEQTDPSCKDTQTLDDANERSPQPVIESASASTAPQDSSSNFAYILTAVVLLVISLLLAALVLLGLGIIGAGLSYRYGYGDGAPDRIEGWVERDHLDRGYRDELDYLKGDLMDDLLGGMGYEV